MLMAKRCRTCCAESACVSCRNVESRVSLLPQDAVPVSLKSRKDRRTSVRAPAAEVRGPRRRQLTETKRLIKEARSEKHTFLLQAMVQLKTFAVARQIDERIAEQQSADSREKKISLKRKTRLSLFPPSTDCERRCSNSFPAADAGGKSSPSLSLNSFAYLRSSSRA